jgi:precorrin-8X/cobalt-precorrin-8 methylmutase
MALNGINRGNLEGFGVELLCLVDDPEVRARALGSGQTRSQVAVDAALDGRAPSGRPLVWAFGNAPTALYRLLERLGADPSLPRPALVAGFPVGFVNAIESKRELARSGLPHFVTNLSRKGGSNVAAAAINALARIALGK